MARPWFKVAQRLGRPPVLSYASYALDNWRRLDPGGPIAVGNLALLQNFLGGLDEEWFATIHVQTEQEAPALMALPAAQAAMAREDGPGLLRALHNQLPGCTEADGSRRERPVLNSQWVYLGRPARLV